MNGSHPAGRREAESEDPERIAIREALAFGKAVYDRRVALGLSVSDLAARAGMTADEIKCIEEGGTEPTIPLLRHLAAALDANVSLTPGHGPGSVGFETRGCMRTTVPPCWRQSLQASKVTLMGPVRPRVMP